MQQLEAWSRDPEKEIFVSVATPGDPFAVSYRGILKRKPEGFFYLKADEALSNVRGISINVHPLDPTLRLAFEVDPAANNTRYVTIYANSVQGQQYRIVVTDVDPFGFL